MLRSRPIGPWIGDASAKKSVAGHVEGMGRVTVRKRLWGRGDEEISERWGMPRGEKSRMGRLGRTNVCPPTGQRLVDLISERAINRSCTHWWTDNLWAPFGKEGYRCQIEADRSAGQRRVSQSKVWLARGGGDGPAIDAHRWEWPWGWRGEGRDRKYEYLMDWHRDRAGRATRAK